MLLQPSPATLAEEAEQNEGLTEALQLQYAAWLPPTAPKPGKAATVLRRALERTLQTGAQDRVLQSIANNAAMSSTKHVWTIAHESP